MKKLISFITTIMLLTAQISLATVRHVPASYATIQAGLNACVTGDTVLVAPGTYYENIIWPVTQGICLLSGSGCNNTIINGNASGRVIDISSGVNIATIIDGFTVKNGYYSNSTGILCKYSSPTIRNCIITGNIAYGTGTDGGGGGITIAYNSSPIVVKNIITNNSAPNSPGGGILVCYSSNPVIDSNIIEDNLAGWVGAGIFVWSGCSAIIRNNQIRGNTASGAYGYGGGLCLYGSSSTIKHNKIENNYATRGGGIFLEQNDVSLFDNDTVVHNTAINYGGGIAILAASPTISNSIVKYNQSYNGGGIGLYNSSPAISNNIISYNKAYYGGGINCEESSNPVISGNRIEFDTAYNYGGGIRCKPNSSPTIRNNFIGNNYADSGGAGIIGSYNCSPLIENNTITENVVSKHGAGVFLAYDCMATIRNNTITKNKAITGSGGGIICLYNSNSGIIKNTIDSNSCGLVGANIFVRTCLSTIDSNSISYSLGNSAVFLEQYSTCQIRNNEIQYNSGIGIQIREDSSTIRNNTITENRGHGIYCERQCVSIINFNNLCVNLGCGVVNYDSNYVVNAKSNWWGHATGPYHPQSNPAGLGDTVSSYVDFTPWLTVIKVGSESKVVSEYYLRQNYPNPFNPKTSIRFELLRLTPVKLIVYDILGKEIATIVNEKLNAGSYVVEWDASVYPSGVYFYKLITEEFVDVKKMVLLK